MLQRPSKTYNLAVQLSQYSNTQTMKRPIFPSVCTPNSYRLPKIVDVDEQGKSSRRKSPFQNIFNIQKQQSMKVSQLNNQKSFNVVGKNQVRTYERKLTKKKNTMQKRNQSALSISRYSSSAKSQNQNSLYLNKEDVLSFLRTSLQEDNTERQNQMMTIGTKKSSNSTSKIYKQLSSLRKCKDRLNNYTKIWDQQKLTKTKFPSILDHISKYRSKVQSLQVNALQQKRKFMKNNIWVQTLRNQKTVTNYYNDKFVQKIINTNENQLKLKGKDKLQKQMQWIQEKDKKGYTFAFLNDLAARSISNKKNQQERLTAKQHSHQNSSLQSHMNMTFSKDSIHKNSICDIQETTDNKQMNNSFANYKKLNAPPNLSQFGQQKENQNYQFNNNYSKNSSKQGKSVNIVGGMR